MKKITFAVPTKEWNATKDHILSINFKDDEPSLTRHQPQHGMEFATFASHFDADIDIIHALLPVSGRILIREVMA